MNAYKDGLFNDLPRQWLEFYEYVQKMKFAETPNYSYLISLMESLILDEAEEVDMVFDWMMPQFYGRSADEPPLVVGRSFSSSEERKDPICSRLQRSVEEQKSSIEIRLKVPKQS